MQPPHRSRDTPSLSTRSPRPRLALVLGSGGVRSVAALGLADVLAAEGIRPDLIVGCSSGALFGAALALGRPIDETLQLALSCWQPELTEQKRWRGYLQLVAPKLARFGPDFSLRDSRPIRAVLERAFGERAIEDLALPLRVSVTDTVSGEAVVLRRGRVVDALAASMAVPFLFPSVAIEGWRFVDGVISDPLPIAAAADADVVIALGFKGVLPRRVDRASRLAGLVSTALINNLQQARVAAARGAGQCVIEMDLPLDRRIGLWETAAMPRIFEAARRGARAHLGEIVRAVTRPARERAA